VEAAVARGIQIALHQMLLQTVAKLTWQATDNGQVGLLEPARTLVGKVASTHEQVTRAFTDEQLTSMLDAAKVATADLTLVDLAARKSARSLLPSTPGSISWAGEELLATLCVAAHIPSQAASLRALSSTVGEHEQAAAVQIVRFLGWAEPDLGRDSPASKGPPGAGGH
jgi:hypothetical protein